jgi:hypothetical protein
MIKKLLSKLGIHISTADYNKGVLTVKKARALLASVPEEEWCTIIYSDHVNNKCCALGHLHRLTSGNPNNYDFGGQDVSDMVDMHFRGRTRLYLSRIHGISSDIAYVNNDSDVNGYTEESIKTRVLHLLDDMIADGWD